MSRTWNLIWGSVLSAAGGAPDHPANTAAGRRVPHPERWCAPHPARDSCGVPAPELGHRGKQLVREHTEAAARPPEPARAAAGLRRLQETTGADELVITTITHGHADRVRSYELPAGSWNR
jgi:hypothetical protein